jgi:hypothetical protein
MLNYYIYIFTLGKVLKTILFLLLIYSINTYANDTDKQGDTVSFFKKLAPSPTTIEKNKSTNSKYMEVKLRTILSDVTQYKNKNNIKTNKLREELTAMKKKFKQYKVKKNKELKKVKKQLYVSNKKVNDKKKKLIQNLEEGKVNKILSRELKEIKKELYLSNKKIDHTKKALIETQNKLNKKETPIIHKVIRKMSPSPILMFDTPWIEIIVENNINIYELAVKYYGDKEAYTKIYLANQNIITNDFKIYNGMSLIIPMTETFEEQPMMLNTY